MKLEMHWRNKVVAAVALLSWLSADPAIAEDRAAATDDDNHIALYYNDGSGPDCGIAAINQRLLENRRVPLGLPGIAEFHSAFFRSRGAQYNWAIPGGNDH